MRVALVPVTFAVFLLFAGNAPAGEVSGPYAAKISAADLAQIKAAIYRNAHVSRNVKKIEAVRPDKVAVQTRVRSAVDQDTVYDFTVAKLKGNWMIDENSIQIGTEQRDFRTNGPSIIR